MSINSEYLHPLFVAEYEEADLQGALSPTEVRDVEHQMDKKAVLVFRGQPLDQDQQIAFARNFGQLEGGFIKVNQRPSRFKYAELADISNVSVDGKVADREARESVGNFANNQLWHSDSSFQQAAARYSMLSASVLPPLGGDTEFWDIHATNLGGRDDLPRELQGLRAERYLQNSRFILGDTDYSESQRNAMPPVSWPLVRTHAGSGRKFLFIGAHAGHIEGRPVAEGRMLLAELLEHATQRKFVYRHRWKVGDLVMWDNRCVLHRGRGYDITARRELRRATTVDDGVV
uniref:2,4-D dioxygenase n=1 Tax=Burkholderia cepacia TaxID=292 RepID=P96312_BURCE|nr:2,4-D dioxygenase [Burkholderia cepacia]